LTRTPRGRVPTGIVASTRSVATSMMLRSRESSLVTYATSAVEDAAAVSGRPLSAWASEDPAGRLREQPRSAAAAAVRNRVLLRIEDRLLPVAGLVEALDLAPPRDGAEHGAVQVRLGQVGPGQVRPGEIGLDQVGVAEVGAGEAGVGELGVRQVRLVQVGP